ncbi:MAG: aspartyl/asparaginyl beta-hydroxylase domain-containing protein [Candidatus Nanopelagicus sp.]
MKLKHRLPTTSIIEHLSLTESQLEQMVNCIHELESEFKSVLEVNKQLCGIHHDLASRVYDNFFQIGLTDSSVENKVVTLEECEVVDTALHKDGAVTNYRKRIEMTTDESSPMNEATYTTKTKIYEKYASVLDGIFDKFKGTTTRARLVKLGAGTSITPHIDYDPSYAVRIIIPIIADAECVNIFWVKNTIETIALQPGKAYFLNTGYKHAVMNFSKNDRYTLLISIKGTQDIDHLL